VAYTHRTADGRTYYLHGEPGARPGGHRQPRYWFARRPWPGATLDALPPGYRVAESPLTRRPYLRPAGAGRRGGAPPARAGGAR
jgi:hypothetical protein